MQDTVIKNQMPTRCEVSNRSDHQLFEGSPPHSREFNEWWTEKLVTDPKGLLGGIIKLAEDVEPCVVAHGLREELTAFLTDVVGEPVEDVKALDEDELSEKFFGCESEILIQKLNCGLTLEHLLAESLIALRGKTMGGVCDR